MKSYLIILFILLLGSSALADSFSVSSPGAISSISNADGTLSISPTTGAVVISLNRTSLALGGATLPTNAIFALNYSPGINTATSGLSIINPNTAAAASQQDACLLLDGQGWKTTATAASQDVNTQICTMPQQGTTNSGAGFQITTQVNGAGRVNVLDYGITSAGNVNIPTLLQVNSVIVGGFIKLLTTATGGNTLEIQDNGGGALALLSVPANNSFHFGGGDVAAPAAQTFGVPGGVGSNISGVSWTLNGSVSTGSGTSGDFVFKTGGSGAATAVQNSEVTALTIKGVTQRVVAAVSIGTGGFAVASLPATAAVGDRAYATDQLTACVAAGAALTGGGSVKCPVFFNGSTWVGD